MGGLTDGLLALPYVEALAAECDSHCWAPVQPILSPSCAGFGCSSLEKNAAELAEVLAYLQRSRGATAFDVIGHSTGCQDAAHLLATAPPHLRIARLVHLSTAGQREARGELATVPVPDQLPVPDQSGLKVL